MKLYSYCLIHNMTIFYTCSLENLFELAMFLNYMIIEKIGILKIMIFEIYVYKNKLFYIQNVNYFYNRRCL